MSHATDKSMQITSKGRSLVKDVTMRQQGNKAPRRRMSALRRDIGRRHNHDHGPEADMSEAELLVPLRPYPCLARRPTR